MKIEFVKNDHENELDTVLYGLNVDQYQYDQEKIIFHNCLNPQITTEMEALKLFTRTKKDYLFGLYLSCHQENIHEKMNDQIYFPFDFAYQNNDLIIFYSFDGEENTELELNEFFKRKELIYKYLKGECGQKYWFALSDFEKKCWLDIAYLKAQLAQMEDRIVKEIILDGAYIESELDLYCHIGEEVGGVLGYMGCNSAALRDCLTDDEIRPTQYPLHIVWKNFEYSLEKFNQDDIQYFIDLLSQNANLKIC